MGMEGLLFYWITWMFWIMVIFFMNRNSKERFTIALCLLVVIILSPKTLTIYGVHFSAAIFFLYFTFLFVLAKFERMLIFSVLLCAFIVMLAYACFLIYELFDPVWLFFPRIWMISGLLAALSIILKTKKIFRFIILMLGAIQGDFLYALILRKYSFPYTIGSFSFLDVASLSFAFLFIWNGIELFGEFFSKYYNQSEKQKQKLS